MNAFTTPTPLEQNEITERGFKLFALKSDREKLLLAIQEAKNVAKEHEEKQDLYSAWCVNQRIEYIEKMIALVDEEQK